MLPVVRPVERHIGKCQSFVGQGHRTAIRAEIRYFLFALRQRAVGASMPIKAKELQEAERKSQKMHATKVLQQVMHEIVVVDTV